MARSRASLSIRARRTCSNLLCVSFDLSSAIAGILSMPRRMRD
jgi:hypothetical protein